MNHLGCLGEQMLRDVIVGSVIGVAPQTALNAVGGQNALRRECGDNNWHGATNRLVGCRGTNALGRNCRDNHWRSAPIHLG